MPLPVGAAFHSKYLIDIKSSVAEFPARLSFDTFKIPLAADATVRRRSNDTASDPSTSPESRRTLTRRARLVQQATGGNVGRPLGDQGSD
jgi:hypothetical protein